MQNHLVLFIIINIFICTKTSYFKNTINYYKMGFSKHEDMWHRCGVQFSSCSQLVDELIPVYLVSVHPYVIHSIFQTASFT